MDISTEFRVSLQGRELWCVYATEGRPENASVNVCASAHVRMACVCACVSRERVSRARARARARERECVCVCMGFMRIVIVRFLRSVNRSGSSWDENVTESDEISGHIDSQVTNQENRYVN